MKTGLRSAIIGQSECGKSHLAKKVLIPRLRSVGVNTLVLDPLGYKDWGATRVWSPKRGEPLEPVIEEFCAFVNENEDCAVFVDEGGLSIGQNPPPYMVSLATTSRHQGHCVFFLAQRWIQISKTMRDQCTHLYLFRVDRKDAEEMAVQFNDDLLRDASLLKPRFFYEKHGLEPAIFNGPVLP